MSATELKALLKDLAAQMPKDANQNQARAVMFHVKRVQIYIQRIVDKQDNRLAKKALIESKKKPSPPKSLKKKHDAEIELAKIDPAPEGEVTIQT